MGITHHDSARGDRGTPLQSSGVEGPGSQEGSRVPVTVGRWLLAAFFVLASLNHFRDPAFSSR